MSFLLINTCQNESWVALANEEKILKLEHWQTSRVSSDLLDKIQQICDLQELDKIGVVTGPGGFTSARLGVVVANSLAKTLNLKVVGMSGYLEPEDLRVMVRDNPGDDLAKPFYQHLPHITSPKK